MPLPFPQLHPVMAGILAVAAGVLLITFIGHLLDRRTARAAAADPHDTVPAMLIRRDDCIITRDGTLYVDETALTGYGRVTVTATCPDWRATYRYDWPVRHPEPDHGQAAL